MLRFDSVNKFKKIIFYIFNNNVKIISLVDPIDLITRLRELLKTSSCEPVNVKKSPNEIDDLSFEFWCFIDNDLLCTGFGTRCLNKDIVRNIY